jgi:dTDP-L-rhamnose 4-epimerase
MEKSDADGKPLNIGSGEPVTIREVASELGRSLGVHIPSELTGKYRAGDIRHCFADISAASQLLGYQPRTRLKEGIAELAGWLHSQQATDSVDEAMERLTVHGLVA